MQIKPTIKISNGDWNERSRKRSAKAFTLAEMVVAVGVSAVFILMLANLLGQTLQISANMQKQMYSVAIAELVSENARKVPYSVLAGYAGKGPQVFNVYTDNNVGAVPRLLPAQFDLSSPDTIFGAVSSSTGTVIPANKWTSSSGNSFKGTIEETVTDVSDKVGVNCVEISVSISYATTGSESKRISRSVQVFEND